MAIDKHQSAEVVTHEDYDRWVVEPSPPGEMKQPRFCFECSGWHAYEDRPEYDGYPTYHTHTECPTCGSREPCGLPPAEEFGR